MPAKRKGYMTIFNPAYFAQTNPNSPIQNDDEIGDVCIPNISPKERQLRKKFAFGQLGVTLLALVALIAFDVNPLWRLLLFFMFSAATTSYIQALEKT
jgi:hypothetical protein